MTVPSILGLQLDIGSTIRQLDALAMRGHEVTCLMTRMRGVGVPSTTESEGLFIETIVLRRKSPVLHLIFIQMKVFWCLARLLGRCDVVILDVYSLPTIFPFLLVRRLAGGLPVVFLRVETNPVDAYGYARGLVLSYLYALSIKFSAAFFDRIYFISPMSARSYSTLGIPSSKLGVWPSPVDLQAFDPESSAKVVAHMQQELGISDRLGVLYHGWLSSSRRIMETVEAFRILKENSVKATLILLGDGPLREEIKRYIEENNLQDFVKLRGPVEYLAVHDYIAACDVGIVPLPDNPWFRYQCPIKVLECLAMNKPLILSDIAAHRWIVGKEPVALYLNGTSPREIVNGILEFVASRKRMSVILGRKLVSRFSITEIARMLEHDILLAVANRSHAD